MLLALYPGFCALRQEADSGSLCRNCTITWSILRERACKQCGTPTKPRGARGVMRPVPAILSHCLH
ncbi:double zinc ribbon domain-containing protein [Shimia aestuarii]|uniref:double zinc ribbon domain-containing protein n=1 Tax=Shimia aestuarii TaxID=254406 RepID=UPI003BF9D9FA